MGIVDFFDAAWTYVRGAFWTFGGWQTVLKITVILWIVGFGFWGIVLADEVVFNVVWWLVLSIYAVPGALDTLWPPQTARQARSELVAEILNRQEEPVSSEARLVRSVHRFDVFMAALDAGGPARSLHASFRRHYDGSRR